MANLLRPRHTPFPWRPSALKQGSFGRGWGLANPVRSHQLPFGDNKTTLSRVEDALFTVWDRLSRPLDMIQRLTVQVQSEPPLSSKTCFVSGMPLRAIFRFVRPVMGTRGLSVDFALFCIDMG